MDTPSTYPWHYGIYVTVCYTGRERGGGGGWNLITQSFFKEKYEAKQGVLGGSYN